MTQLHEILAVEGDLRGTKDKIKEETIHTFKDKQAHFYGRLKTLKMFDDTRQDEEAGSEERKELVTTVHDKLKYMSKAFAKFWDVKLKKETGNQQATSDVIINGEVFAKDLPVTFLLGMEEELKQLRKVYDTIPTLQPGIDWESDTQKGEHIYKTKCPIIRHKTEQIIAYKIIVPATKEHPAQVREWSEQKPVGNYTENTWSGMLTPVGKSRMLSNLDIMLRAIKKARQRANNQKLTDDKIGATVFNFIHN